MRVFWWNAHPNFGDGLAPILLDRFSGVKAVHATPANAEIVVIGSVIDSLPDDWPGIICGAGRLYENRRPRMDDAHIYAVRGRLSTLGLRSGSHRDFVLGDPGLLVSELIPAPEKRYELGIVPHWSDPILPTQFSRWNPHIIYPDGDPLAVVEEIAACRKIVSSSLHGVVVADSFGIPRRTEIFTRAIREGGDFKFRDYATAIGQPIEFGKLQSPNRQRIESVQSELFDVFKSLRGKQ